MRGYHLTKSEFNGRFYLHHKGNSVPVRTLEQAWAITEVWERQGVAKPDAEAS